MKSYKVYRSVNNPNIVGYLHSNSEFKIKNVETGAINRYHSTLETEYGVIKKIHLYPEDFKKSRKDIDDEEEQQDRQNNYDDFEEIYTPDC